MINIFKYKVISTSNHDSLEQELQVGIKWVNCSFTIKQKQWSDLLDSLRKIPRDSSWYEKPVLNKK
jgi:hypothetical protein